MQDPGHCTPCVPAYDGNGVVGEVIQDMRDISWAGSEFESNRRDDMGPTEDLRLKHASLSAQAFHVFDQQLHRIQAITGMRRQRDRTVVTRKKDMVHPADPGYRVEKTGGNTRSEKGLQNHRLG